MMIHIDDNFIRTCLERHYLVGSAIYLPYNHPLMTKTDNFVACLWLTMQLINTMAIHSLY